MYPMVIFLRQDQHSDLDPFFETNKQHMIFSITIISNKEEINKLFDPSYQVLVSYGEEDFEKEIDHSLLDRFKPRWIHYKSFDDIRKWNKDINFCYMNAITNPLIGNRPVFSLFTTCYKSYDKIVRAYHSIQQQTMTDWEWVILDDTPEDEHFLFLTSTFQTDDRIRLYKRSQNSGSIGNVKNEVVSLCRGRYVLEMDHDDEILPDTLADAVAVFDKDPAVGFIYMDYCNLYEDGRVHSYGNFFALGYGGYYCEKYKNTWVNVAVQPNINNISLAHIVAVPNHPRIWRKDTLMQIGNYSEFLPVCDDYELLLRTAVSTKMARVRKLAYIQYMNNNNNNFSLIRNSEINRLCPYLGMFCYAKYNINEKMKELGAYEDDKYKINHSQIWKRSSDYKYKYCNDVYNLDYDKQYCIIGYENLNSNIKNIKKLYQDQRNDFLLLDNKLPLNDLSRQLDFLRLDRMKCYSMVDCTNEELENYFHLIYRSCADYFVYKTRSRIRVTIITPSIRLHHLQKLKESIRFEYIHEWIIVYDGSKIENNPQLFKDENKITEYLYKGTGINGNAQRNYALDHVKHTDTYLYYLDDDNIIHPDLYLLLDELQEQKFYTFNQSRPKDVFPFKELLTGDNVSVKNIDTAMVLIDFRLCRDIRWEKDRYDADGVYIAECFRSNKDNWIYIDKTLAYYNKIDYV
jgi:glycosyltransferase involved in cell wall biosynthesis